MNRQLRTTPRAAARGFALTFPGALLAHDGHGDRAWIGSVVHYLIEPAHLPLTLAGLVLLALTWRWALAAKRG